MRIENQEKSQKCSPLSAIKGNLTDSNTPSTLGTSVLQRLDLVFRARDAKLDLGLDSETNEEI